MHAGFVEHLKRKYGSTDKLNKLWGFAYWGQLVDGWDELLRVLLPATGS